MVVTSGQQYNVGEKPTVILYTFYCTDTSIGLVLAPCTVQCTVRLYMSVFFASID